MAKFVAIHNLGPGAREMFAQAAPAMAAWLKDRYAQVVWNGVHIQWETGKAVCLWEAPDAESVVSLFEELQVPYDDIYPVEWFTPHDLAVGA